MNTRIDNILDKYWAGETTREEEAMLRSYFTSDNVDVAHREYVPLFSFFEKQSSIVDDRELDLSFAEEKRKPKLVHLTRIIAVAASLALLLTVSLQLFNTADQTEYKYKYTELQDPEEALEITMEALGFLSAKYEKGAQPATRHFKQLEKTAVFDIDS